MISENAVHSELVEINAPVELVWEILTDFADYKSWNSFTPSIETKLELGAEVKMQVDLGEGLQEQIEYMSRIEENTAIAWSMTLKDKETLEACRTQHLKSTSDSSCTYESIDAFSGSLTADVLKFQGENIERGFNRCALELKQYAESRFQESLN